MGVVKLQGCKLVATLSDDVGHDRRSRRRGRHETMVQAICTRLEQPLAPLCSVYVRAVALPHQQLGLR